MINVLVPYTYPHKGGLPDLDQMLYWSGVHESFYKVNNTKYTMRIEIGALEIKVIFDIQRDLL